MVLRQALNQLRDREAVRVDGLPIAPEDIQAVADLRPGDRITLVTPHGQKRNGKVVITSGTHAACNMGGRFGTAGVVTPRNIVAVNGKPV